jgi:glutathionylspermidine synthase
MAATSNKDKVFCDALIHDAVVTDPYVDGTPRVSSEPRVLEAAEAEALASAAEAIGAAFNEAYGRVLDEPELLTSYFAMSPWQIRMLQEAKGLWHGIARADLFFGEEGLWMAELNSDTPTGEPEATTLGRVWLEQNRHKLDVECIDPNRDLQNHFAQMVRRYEDLLPETSEPRSVGILYPTEFTEDLTVVSLYQKWLQDAEYRVVLGAPFNLGRAKRDGAQGEACVCLFGQPIDLLLRHYKTDWWFEGKSAWLDEVTEEQAPLERELELVLAAQAKNELVLINPFGALLAQNKRMMAFLWDYLHEFSVTTQETIAAYVPQTIRLETALPLMLEEAREQWVIKSDYGAEGDEVIVGRAVTDEVWRKLLALARPGCWVAQRYMESARNKRGEVENFGVYLVAGRAAGIYLRSQVGATDAGALSVPVLVKI